MSCQRFREIVSSLLDDEAPSEEVGEVLAHLESCPECRSFREELLADRTRLRAWPDELPDALGAGTAALLERPATPRRWTALAAAAALILALTAGFVTGRLSKGGEPPMETAGDRPAEPAFQEVQRAVFPESNQVYSYAVLKTADAGDPDR
jgi:anti-sigma factor RsiW